MTKPSLAEALPAPKSPANQAPAAVADIVGPRPPSAEKPGADYDLLPYPSMPFPHTEPAYLAAVAALFGLAAADAGCARVLELGCAAGGNLIPLAARFPGASFVGVDLSGRQIDDGHRRVEALHLSNIRLHQADLTTLDMAGQVFDFIICNGVFSWVPKQAQDAIFRLCRQTAAPEGVVTISYNVLPGWHLRMVVRDLCLQYAGEGSPQHRVARARAALDRMAEASSPDEPYGLLLRTEARRMKNVPAAYVMGEFLAPDNRPCYVSQFIEQAAENGFDYLCEADLSAPAPPSPGATADERASAEQHMDFQTGRLFRRSVLVRSRRNVTGRPVPSALHLSNLHVSSPVRADAARSREGQAIFVDERARPVMIKDAAIRRSIERLEKAYPATLTMTELAVDPASGAAPGAAPGIQPVSGRRLAQAVFTMVMAGRASISALPLHVGRAAAEQPSVWSVAREEAKALQPWITSLRHVGVPLRPILKALVPHIDGNSNRLELRSIFVSALKAGRVEIAEINARQPVPSPADLDALASKYVEAALEYLERHGFLEPGFSRSGPIRSGVSSSASVIRIATST